MIVRGWRGWPTPGQESAYERLLNETIAPGIMRRGVPGLRELAVLRRVADDRQAGCRRCAAGRAGPPDAGDPVGTEFLTLMTFDDWAAVTDFAGADPGASVVPPAARELLADFDARSRHYELGRRHRPSD